MSSYNSPSEKQCSPCLTAQPPLTSGGFRHLRCFSAGSYPWAHNLWGLIVCLFVYLFIYLFIYLFFLLVMLPSQIPRVATDPPVRVFPGVWKLLFFKTPFPKQISILTFFVSLFIFYILSYILLKTMCCLSGCLMSSASI